LRLLYGTDLSQPEELVDGTVYDAVLLADVGLDGLEHIPTVGESLESQRGVSFDVAPVFEVVFDMRQHAVHFEIQSRGFDGAEAVEAPPRVDDIHYEALFRLGCGVPFFEQDVSAFQICGLILGVQDDGFGVDAFGVGVGVHVGCCSFPAQTLAQGCPKTGGGLGGGFRCKLLSENQ